MSQQYTLTLTGEQLRVVDRACDVLHRLHMGQFDPILSDVFAFNPPAHGETARDNSLRRDRLAQKLRAAEPDMTALPAPGFHAIGSPAIGDSARVAYDIVKVIRYLRWQENGEQRPNVYGYPVRRLSGEPLPLLSVARVFPPATRQKWQTNLAGAIALAELAASSTSSTSRALRQMSEAYHQDVSYLLGLLGVLGDDRPQGVGERQEKEGAEEDVTGERAV